MYCVQSVAPDVLYLGSSDRRLDLFENVYPIPKGTSYNSYLVMDEKTVLLDTVDHSIAERFFENLEHALNGRPLDYVIVNHMEPDHCATLGDVLHRWPNATVIGTAKTVAMMGQFFDCSERGRCMAVKEGDTLTTGKHTFTFLMASMVHWPEVMVTYDSTDHILFSADAFGTFGALSGNIFADQTDFQAKWLPEARRYYTNIVGKYGSQVQSLLKKMAGIEVRMVCPLHGPIWRENLDWLVEKYQKWSTYTPEEQRVMIACGSVYGNTENAMEILANRLAEKGVTHIALYDVSHTDVSELVSEAFRCSHLVFASATYNGGIFTPMENFLLDLKAHNLQNRTVVLVDNGSWAATAGKQMRAMVSEWKNTTVWDESVTLTSTVKEEQRAALEALADKLAEDLLK